MIRSLPPSLPKYPSPPARAEIEEAQKSDPLFDLSTFDNGREIYFMPQMDRLPHWLAQQAQQPLRVHFEAENQFIDYTVTTDPKATIQANVNGKAFDIASGVSDSGGECSLKASSEAGDFNGDLYTIKDGTEVSGFAGPNNMPVQQSLWRVAQPGTGDPVMEGSGSFACAKMATDWFPEGDNLHLMGRLGVHNIDAMLSPAEKGWILEGEFGDIRFKQTFTKADAPRT